MKKQPISIPKLISFIVVVCFCIGLAVWFSPIFSGKREYYEAKAQGKTIDVVFENGKLVIKAEVATSNDDLARGLSDRDSLSAGFGMLFDLGAPAKETTFWMNKMEFDLDMIWILNGKIVGIDRSVPFPKKNEQPALIKSPGRVTHVLEITPGQSGFLNVGDPVLFR